MKTKLLALIISFLLLLTLAGCGQVGMDFELKADGTGTFNLRHLIDERFLDMDYNGITGAEWLEDQMQSLSEQGISPAVLFMEEDGVVYEGYEYSLTLEQALHYETVPDAYGSTEEYFSAWKLELGEDPTLTYTGAIPSNYEDELSQALRTELSLNVEGTILHIAGSTPTVQDDGTVVCSTGNKDIKYIEDSDGQLTIDYSSFITWEGEDYAITWKISQELANTLKEFPSMLVLDAGNYTDIADHWAFEALCYLNAKDIMNGTSTTTMEPDKELTREQIVTLLYRAAGSPQYTPTVISDVAKDRYSYGAICWAIEEGLTNGTSVDAKGNMVFSPALPLTVEQAIVLIDRYAMIMSMPYKYLSVTGDYSDQCPETEASSWAQESIQNLKNRVGIPLYGDDACIKPKSIATRGYFAYLLYQVLSDY